ncbi:hypothetical protein V6N13_048584 [Hibiscus sabdariffa]
MFHLLLCKCFDKLLKQDDKGDVSTETMGPARQVSRLVLRFRQSVLLCYWLIPKSCNCSSCLYTISLSRKAVTSLLPLSQEYFPHKANCCYIFLAAETLLLPIPRRRLLSAETCTPSRLCVFGLRIGSADRLGPWFDALLVQWCLEKYADHIALPVVFSLPAEVGVSAGCIGGSLDAHHMACVCVRNSDHMIFRIPEPVLGSLLPGTSSRQKCPPRTSFGQPITRHF